MDAYGYARRYITGTLTNEECSAKYEEWGSTCKLQTDLIHLLKEMVSRMRSGSKVIFNAYPYLATDKPIEDNQLLRGLQVLAMEEQRKAVDYVNAHHSNGVEIIYFNEGVTSFAGHECETGADTNPNGWFLELDGDIDLNKESISQVYHFNSLGHYNWADALADTLESAVRDVITYRIATGNDNRPTKPPTSRPTKRPTSPSFFGGIFGFVDNTTLVNVTDMNVTNSTGVEVDTYDMLPSNDVQSIIDTIEGKDSQYAIQPRAQQPREQPRTSDIQPISVVGETIQWYMDWNMVKCVLSDDNKPSYCEVYDTPDECCLANGHADDCSIFPDRDYGSHVEEEVSNTVVETTSMKKNKQLRDSVQHEAKSGKLRG